MEGALLEVRLPFIKAKIVCSACRVRLLHGIKAGLHLRPPKEFDRLKADFFKQRNMLVNSYRKIFGIKTFYMFLRRHAYPAVLNLKPFPAFESKLSPLD